MFERVTASAAGLRERLDALIDTVSPRMGAERRAWRATSEHLGSRIGRKTRIRGDIPSGGRADHYLGSDRWNEIEVARRLERESPLAESLLARSVENIVGPGFGHQAKTGSPRWNKRVEKLWAEWCEGPCDVRGLSPMSELLRLTCRGRLRDGDQGTALLSVGSLQIFESDQIVSPSRSPVPTKNMVDGVELDHSGRPIAYHVVSNPDPVLGSVRFGNKTTEIPAESFVFTAKRTRHGQTRGMPPLAKIAWLLEQIDGNIQAVTVASRMAACIGLVIQRDKKTSGLPTDQDGRPLLKLQPGFVAEVGQKDNVTQVQQTQPGTDWPNYLAALLRLAALEFGLPLEIGFLDVSRANYTNLRAAYLQSQRTWKIEQDALKCWLTAIYRWKVYNWIREGKLEPRRDAFAHLWVPAPWTWVDPEKEFKAKLAAVDAGVLTKGMLALEQGHDLADIAEARGKELELFEKHKIPEVRSTLTRDPVVAQEAEEPEEPEPEPTADPKKAA